MTGNRIAHFTALTTALVLVACGLAFAQSTDTKTFTVKRGQKVVVAQSYNYDGSACRPSPPQPVHIWQQPKLGQLRTEVVDNAPVAYGYCQGKTATLQRVIFEAGSSPGEDSFVLMAPWAASQNGQPWPVTYKYRVQ